MPRSYIHLELQERALIETQLRLGMSPAAIAVGLMRARSTVLREILGLILPGITLPIHHVQGPQRRMIARATCGPHFLLIASHLRPPTHASVTSPGLFDTAEF
jgi:hypothetical protein